MITAKDGEGHWSSGRSLTSGVLDGLVAATTTRKGLESAAGWNGFLEDRTVSIRGEFCDDDDTFLNGLLFDSGTVFLVKTSPTPPPLPADWWKCVKVTDVGSHSDESTSLLVNDKPTTGGGGDGDDRSLSAGRVNVNLSPP